MACGGGKLWGVHCGHPAAAPAPAPEEEGPRGRSGDRNSSQEGARPGSHLGESNFTNCSSESIFPFFLGLYGQQPANQVIIRERYQDSDSDLALGVLAGAATGMALGSLFWVF